MPEFELNATHNPSNKCPHHGHYIFPAKHSRILTIYGIDGLEHFGLRVADDYELLIEQALRDLMENPHRNGTKPVSSHQEDIYSYPIIHSKSRAEGDIKHPRHAVYFYLIEKHIVAIASIARQGREAHINTLQRSVVEEELQKDER